MDDGKAPWADYRESRGKTITFNNKSQYRMSVAMCQLSCWRGVIGKSMTIIQCLALNLSFAAS